MSPAVASFLWGMAGALVVNFVCGVAAILVLVNRDEEPLE